jgi:glutaredoxin 3
VNIVIYTKTNCPNCTTAKRLLDSKSLDYTAYDVETDIGYKKMLAQVDAQYRQMPQIFINNQRVGGLAGLQNALKELGL